MRILKDLHCLFLKNKKTLATAESCTAGTLSRLLTAHSGSSGYFILGVTTYSNKMKVKVLKIPPGIIQKHGAVCREVASLMARNVRIIARADIGVGITGIAGPTGGSIDKPVGTVFIAVDTHGKKACRRFVFKGNRETIRKKASLEALQLIKNNL